LNWIEDYKNYILQNVKGCNPSLAESIACAVLGTVANRRLMITTEIGELYPNFFFFTIGYSGTFKSVPIKYFVFPLLQEYAKLPGGEDLILPSKFSIEGFIENLSKGAKGIILRDEFSGLLKSAKKEYLSELIEFLSELYDCTLQKRYTKSAKSEEQKNVFVSLITNTTPYMFSLMDYETFFLQGFGNRCLFDFNDSSKPLVISNEFFMGSYGEWKRPEEIQEFANRLLNINTKLSMLPEPLRAGTLDNKIVDFGNEINKKVFALTKEGDELSASYYKRMNEICIKLASIHALARQENVPDFNKIPDLILPLLSQDITFALNKTNKHLEDYEKIKALWKVQAPSVKVKTAKAPMERIIEILKMNGGTMKHTELFKATAMISKDFSDLIETMVYTGVIKRSIVNREGKGRPAICYQISS
jgi:predicted transcriptional regulator